MTDQQDRQVESEESEQSRYERELDEDARRRHEAAERLKGDPLLAPEDR
ncbi:MAG: hypothetical protein ACRDN6_00780 [Gaiellaceae bacterium]